jgi:hypothetical protein
MSEYSKPPKPKPFPPFEFQARGATTAEPVQQSPHRVNVLKDIIASEFAVRPRIITSTDKPIVTHYDYHPPSPLTSIPDSPLSLTSSTYLTKADGSPMNEDEQRFKRQKNAEAARRFVGLINKKVATTKAK